MIKQLNVLPLFICFLIQSSLNAQEQTSEFGLKAGLNCSKYVPNKNAIDYKHKIGFYAGGFVNVQIEEWLRFQPELLFALQGSDVEVRDIVTTIGGNPIGNIQPYDFEYQVNELSFLIPLMGQIYFSDRFYIETGPQFTFIVDRNLNSSQQLFPGEDADFIVDDGDTFDFGINIGFGYTFSKTISMNMRAIAGLVERDDNIKSIIYNLGIEYRL